MTQAPFPMPAPAPPRSGRPGPGLGVSISLMVVGALIGIVATVAIAVPFVNAYTSRSYGAPSHYSIHLRHGRYTVFERTGTRSGFSFGPGNGRITIDPSQVTVTGPDGERVTVLAADDDETMKRDSDDYRSAVEFDARSSGNYDVRLSTRIVTSVIITRSPQEVVRSVLAWFGAGGVGGLMFVAGLVLLIVGITRRGRARRAAPVGWGQPPWGQPAWGQPPWGAPPQYPPPQYPPPQYPPTQYPPPQYPPPGDQPPDPWAPKG
jgi:hypothetical protein